MATTILSSLPANLALNCTMVVVAGLLAGIFSGVFTGHRHVITGNLVLPDDIPLMAIRRLQ